MGWAAIRTGGRCWRPACLSRWPKAVAIPQHRALVHMRNVHRSLIAAALIAGVSSAQLVAQAPLSGSVLHVSPYAGTLISSSFLNGPLGTTLSNSPGLLYGTQVGLSLAPELSLIGNIGYSTSDMKVGIPFLGGVTVGHSALLLYDAGLEYSLARATERAIRFAPFIQAGVGAMKYDVSAS